MHAATPPSPPAPEPNDDAPSAARRDDGSADVAHAAPVAAPRVTAPRVTAPPVLDTAARRAEALRAANGETSSYRTRAVLGTAGEWLRVIPLALACFLLVKAVLVEAYKIPSGSMERTLLPGDFLLVNKLVYGATLPFTNTKLPALREPARGDIVVFEWPADRTKNFVKRLVALPGDTVAMKDGRLVLNGLEQDERYAIRSEPGADPVAVAFRWQRGYLVRTASANASASANAADDARRRYRPSRNNWGPLVVPDDHYFVLGDNRDNSLDSRYWGFVPDSLVLGTPLVVYYSFAPDSAAPVPWLTRVRWDRLGTRVR
jgi:signal peptidase I